MTGRKVFIVNDSGNNFSPARIHGELIPLSEHSIDRYDVNLMKAQFETQLRTSDCEDFILHTGPGVMSAIACAIFAARHNRLNLLLWCANAIGSPSYVPARLIFNQTEEDL